MRQAGYVQADGFARDGRSHRMSAQIKVTDAKEPSRCCAISQHVLQKFREKGSVLIGDVHPDAVNTAGALTPVPGGVGPMTIAMLMTTR